MTHKTTPCRIKRLSDLRAALETAGYKEDVIRERLAVPTTSTLPPVGHSLSFARLALSTQDTQSALIRLLFLGHPIQLSEAPNLTAGIIDLLTNANLVTRSHDILHPISRLIPFYDLLLATDHHNEDSTEVRSDAVENPHHPTEVLARLIPRGIVGRSLDIGTGSGVHALQLASHSNEVLGVDVSSRAVAFAEFNAALNGITNARFEIADVVNGIDHEERFNLIVSNPPYLVSPETSVLYRDGPPRSAHVGTRVLSEASSLLAPEGMLVCLTSWAISNKNDPAREIRNITQKNGYNALVFIYAIKNNLEDALRWNSHRGDPNQIYHAAQRWMDFYREQGISNIAYGIVILMRSRYQRSWFRVERVTLQGQEFDQGQLRDIISALDRPRGSRVPESLRIHPDHKIESVSKIRSDGTRGVQDQVLCSTRGLRFYLDCGPRLLSAISNGDLASSEQTTSVIQKMRLRLYELGLIVENPDA